MKHLWVTLLVVGLAFLPGLAHATMVLYSPLPEMAKKSDLIVHALVTGQKVARDESGRIKTYSTLQVLESVRGATKNEALNLSQVGGELDGETAQVIGTSSFTVGEEVVLFGARMPDRVVMFAVGVGKYRVYSSAGQKYAIAEVGDVQLVKRKPEGGLESVKHPIPTAIPLSDFLQNVRNHVKTAGVK